MGPKEEGEVHHQVLLISAGAGDRRGPPGNAHHVFNFHHPRFLLFRSLEVSKTFSAHQHSPYKKQRDQEASSSSPHLLKTP